jgi:hypothetical protein
LLKFNDNKLALNHTFNCSKEEIRLFLKFTGFGSLTIIPVSSAKRIGLEFPFIILGKPFM